MVLKTRNAAHQHALPAQEKRMLQLQGTRFADRPIQNNPGRFKILPKTLKRNALKAGKQSKRTPTYPHKRISRSPSFFILTVCMSGKTPQTIGPAIIKDIAKNIKQSASPLRKTSFPITVLSVAKNGFFCCQERNILLLNTGQTVAKHGTSRLFLRLFLSRNAAHSFSKCGSLYLKVRKFSTGNPQVSDRRNRRTRFISALMQQRATRHQQQNLHTATISVPQTPYRKI